MGYLSSTDSVIKLRKARVSRLIISSVRNLSMSHAQIMAMLHRQVAADGGAMSGGAMSGGASAGAMAGNFSSASAQGLAKYHSWKAQQPAGMSRSELKAAWRHHKAVQGGFVGERPVRAMLKNRQAAYKLVADNAMKIADQHYAAYQKAKYDAAAPAARGKQYARAVKEAKLRQYNAPGATTAALHAALAALEVPEHIYIHTKVSKPRKAKAGPAARIEEYLEQMAPEPEAERGPAGYTADELEAMISGAGLSGGRRYRRY
jgi:hypothetical protein